MSTIFFKGVVVDVLNSTSDVSITNDSLSDVKKNTTSDAMKNFPRNTVIVKTISEGLAKRTDVKTICYPFFSSHLSMPLKVGEYVWFVYENPDMKGSIAYWLSRVCEPEHVEDVNYNFAARTYIQQAKKPAKRTSDKFEGSSNDEGDQQTYSWQSPTSDPEEMINLVDLARKNHRFEAVPRYTKRPGDLVLQGSNNSLIMLGEERGQQNKAQLMIAGANNPPDGLQPGHPAIDIVVGRGVKDPDQAGEYLSVRGNKFINEFGIEEIDKREKSNVEGDAHFVVDATRIYLTANSDNVNSSYHPDFLLNLRYPNSAAGSETAPPRSQGAFAVVKSDNLRLVSRDVGTIRIVKEPSFGSINGSAIMMHDDGRLHAAGSKIYLTRYMTNGAVEPYIKQSALIGFLNSLLSDLSTLCNQINSAGSTLSTAGGSLSTAGGALAIFPPTAPAAAPTTTAGINASAAGSTLTSAAATALASISEKVALLKNNQVNVNGKVTPLGSTVIYGE